MFNWFGNYLKRERRTAELTGRGDYVQSSIQSIKLRKRLPALWSNDLLCVPPIADFCWGDFDADFGIPVENISAVPLGRHLGA